MKLNLLDNASYPNFIPSIASGTFGSRYKRQFYLYSSYLLLLVKKLAPSWSCNAVLDGQITKLSSNDLKGEYNIILFYPLDLYYKSFPSMFMQN